MLIGRKPGFLAAEALVALSLVALALRIEISQVAQFQIQKQALQTQLASARQKKEEADIAWLDAKVSP